MKFGDVFLAGIGTAQTPLVESSTAVERGWWTAAEAEAAGLESVSVAGSTPAPDLAVEAARTALAMSGVDPVDFCGVFHTSVHPQGPDGWSVQHYVNRRTVNQPVTSAEIRNGCVGVFSNLMLSSAFLQQSDRSAALLTCADNFGTPVVDRWKVSRLFVLGDGGGAVVLSRDGGFARLLAVGATSDPELESHHRGGEALFPPGITEGAMLDFDKRMAYGQHQAEAGLVRPMGDFGSVLVDTVERTLKEAGVTLDEISRVVHDGFNRDPLRFIFLDPLGIEAERGIWEFTKKVGHAGPLDQIRGLEYAWRERLVSPGDKVLLLSGSPGMEAACAVLEIDHLPA